MKLIIYKLRSNFRMFMRRKYLREMLSCIIGSIEVIMWVIFNLEQLKYNRAEINIIQSRKIIRHPYS